MRRRDFIKTGLGAALAAVLPVPVHASPGRSDYAATGVEIRTSTPLRDGFTMPPEWALHEMTIMAWPGSREIWGKGLEAVTEECVGVAHSVARFEPVLMVVAPGRMKEARNRLGSGIELLEMEVDDIWTRDTAPLVLVNDRSERAATGFRFNAWGEKFKGHDADCLLKARLARYLDLPFYPMDVVGEGGAVIHDGEGTIITTAECMQNPNRNPRLSRTDLDRAFLDYLDGQKNIWLPEGLKPDLVTDGHVDGLCAYAAPGVVLLHMAHEDDPLNHRLTRDAKKQLEATTDAKGRSLEVIEIPLGERISHMNFYICNGGVVVPVTGDHAEDDDPLAILREVFADREVVGTQGLELARGGGGVHCITQQVPLAG